MSPKQTTSMAADGSWNLGGLATAIMDYELLHVAKLKNIVPREKQIINDVTFTDDRGNPQLSALSLVKVGDAETAPNPAPDPDAAGRSKVFQGVIFVEGTKADVAGYR